MIDEHHPCIQPEPGTYQRTPRIDHYGTVQLLAPARLKPGIARTEELHCSEYTPATVHPGILLEEIVTIVNFFIYLSAAIP